jgi:hypothetical protein
MRLRHGKNAEYKKSSENDLIDEGMQRRDRKARMRKKTSCGSIFSI